MVGILSLGWKRLVSTWCRVIFEPVEVRICAKWRLWSSAFLDDSLGSTGVVVGRLPRDFPNSGGGCSCNSLVVVVSAGVQWAAHERWIESFSRSREYGGMYVRQRGLWRRW